MIDICLLERQGGGGVAGWVEERRERANERRGGVLKEGTEGRAG